MPAVLPWFPILLLRAGGVQVISDYQTLQTQAAFLHHFGGHLRNRLAIYDDGNHRGGGGSLGGNMDGDDYANSLFQQNIEVVAKNGTLIGRPAALVDRLAFETSSLRGLAHGRLSDWERQQLPGMRHPSFGDVGNLRHAGGAEAHSSTMAEMSANRTGALLQQVALQSAGLMYELQMLDHARRAASPAFPHRHVASRRVPRQWVEPPKSRGPLNELDEPAGSFDIGMLRVSLTLTGLFVVLLSVVWTGKGRSLFSKEVQQLPVDAYFQVKAMPALHRHHYTRCQRPDSKALSVWDGTVATFSTIVGTGLLSMPYAFSLAGLVAVPVVIFFVCCSLFTAHLMAWTFSASAAEAAWRGVEPSKRGWGFLVELAFGQRAKRAINAFLIVELWSYLLSCIVCMEMNINQLVEGLSVSGAVLISVILAYALTFVRGELLTKINVLSNVVFILTGVMFIITGFLLPQKAPSSEVQFIKPQGLITAAGILVFSPAGHSFYPAIMQQMKEPEKYPVCIRRSYLGACALYLAMAVPGYYLFGNAAQPSAVQNIGVDLHLVPLPDLGWMNTAAALGMVTKMLAMQPLILTPLVSTVESVCAGSESGLNAPPGLVAPTILALSAGVAVHFAHEMAELLNLIGSIFCMTIAFVVPVLCYWRLTREPLRTSTQVIFVSLILMGSTFAVIGVITAL